MRNAEKRLLKFAPFEIFMGMRPRKSEMPPSRHIVTSFAVSVSDAIAELCGWQFNRLEKTRAKTGPKLEQYSGNYVDFEPTE